MKKSIWTLTLSCNQCEHKVDIDWEEGDTYGNEMEVARDLLKMHKEEECDGLGLNETSSLQSA